MQPPLPFMPNKKTATVAPKLTEAQKQRNIFPELFFPFLNRKPVSYCRFKSINVYIV